MEEIWLSFVQLLNSLGQFAWAVSSFLITWWVVILWLAWWLCAVNWRKVWPVLASGAWLAVVLTVFLAALSWSRLVAHPRHGFWWYLGATALIACLTLLCGWLQEVFGWTPADVDLEPPPATAHSHHH
jgi:hypothetical protein